MYYISMRRCTFQGPYKNEFEGLKFISNQIGDQWQLYSEEYVGNGLGSVQVG